MENTTVCLPLLLRLVVFYICRSQRGARLSCACFCWCVLAGAVQNGLRCLSGRWSFESFQGKVKYLTQASVLIRGTSRVLLAAEPRCNWGDSGMGNIWMHFLELWRWQSTVTMCSWDRGPRYPTAADSLQLLKNLHHQWLNNKKKY